jgi:hypothetical protein
MKYPSTHAKRTQGCIDYSGFHAPKVSFNVNSAAFDMIKIATILLPDLIEAKRPVTDFETRVLTTELLIRDCCGQKKLKQKEPV